MVCVSTETKDIVQTTQFTFLTSWIKYISIQLSMNTSIIIERLFASMYLRSMTFKYSTRRSFHALYCEKNEILFFYNRMYNGFD